MIVTKITSPKIVLIATFFVFVYLMTLMIDSHLPISHEDCSSCFLAEGSIQQPPEDRSPTKRTSFLIILVSIVVSVAVLACIIFILFIIWRRKMSKKQGEN